MKKLSYLLLLLLIFCGPSEDEIQQRIDDAVNDAISTTSTLSTTTIIDSSSTTSTTKTNEIDCVAKDEKRFEIVINNNSSTNKDLGLFFYISALFDPIEDKNIKTHCVTKSEQRSFSFNFNLENKPVIGQYGEGTQDWYNICFKSKQTYFDNNEKIIFNFTDEEIYISSKLIYDRIIDRKNGKVTFIEDDLDKPITYCDNIDLATSLPSTTTTTTLPENIVIEFENCKEKIRDDSKFILNFNVYAGNEILQNITLRQKFLDINQLDDFNELGLSIPKKGEVSSYQLEYSFGSNQVSNYQRESIVNVKTTDGVTVSKTCKSTIVITNPVTTTTTPTKTTTTTILSTTSTSTTTTTTIVNTNLYPDTPSSSSWYRFSGSGDDIVDISSVGGEVMIAAIEHSGSSNFIVTGLDSELGYQDLKINEIGSYRGIVPINFENRRNYYLEINADGSWEVVIKPIASAENFDSNSISGSGDSIIEAYELKSRDQLNFTHSGSSNFIVTQYRCNGSYNSYVINEIGSYDGKVVTDSGTCYLEIIADGNWSISK